MSMLLGVAKELAQSRNFSETVHLIFQPAEEMQGQGADCGDDYRRPGQCD
jgi:metal-dependent amidase/aminoacylase/carboxypeptidase family protein